MKKIILGSASPRRRALLAQIGIEFEVAVSEKEEFYVSTEPEEIVKELALMKARNVAGEKEGQEAVLKEISGQKTDTEEEAERETLKNTGIKNTIVIGADTIVALDGKILGKPKDEADAFQMVKSIQGRTHQVFTGVAFLDFNENGMCSEFVHAEETKVYVHAMEDAEIRTYIQTGESMDKAGGYGIQGGFAAYIDRIDGDYFNVVGLPVSYVYQQLKQLM